MSIEAPSPEDFHQTEPDLWSVFVASRNDEDYYRGWLGLQCTLISGVVQGLVVVATGSGDYRPLAGWPDGTIDPARLTDLIERVVEERCGLLVELEDTGSYGIAYPLIIDEVLTGIVALETSVNSEAGLKTAMEQLQWGTAWLELLVRRKRNEQDTILLHRLKSGVDLLAASLGEQKFQSAVMMFTTKTAKALNCERVSLGFLRNRHVKLLAVSHSAEVGKKMNLTRAIEQVMEEALAQRAEIIFPESRDRMQICREHEELSRLQSMASIVTIPLFSADRFYGAVTCERAAEQPFSETDVDFLKAAAGLAGPALETKYENSRPLVVKVLHSCKTLLQKLFGKSHLGLKLTVMAVIALVSYVGFADGDYRLTADTRLEGALRRAIVVPFDGYIDQASARVGDVVAEGDVLCTLDSRNLRLEKLAKISKNRQMERQYQEAMAKHDRAQAGIVKARLEQLQAEIDLVENRLQRTRMTAPFAGLLVSGDLNQRLGSAVDQGEILFELTPLDSYRVILEVDERRIADVRKDQEGMLVLSSLPDQSFPFVVETITPLTIAEEGRNYFRVEARLAYMDESLRPGMEGVGKISIDRRRLISIWGRELADWFKISMWSWMP